MYFQFVCSWQLFPWNALLRKYLNWIWFDYNRKCIYFCFGIVKWYMHVTCTSVTLKNWRLAIVTCHLNGNMHRFDFFFCLSIWLASVGDKCVFSVCDISTFDRKWYLHFYIFAHGIQIKNKQINYIHSIMETFHCFVIQKNHHFLIFYFAFVIYITSPTCEHFPSRTSILYSRSNVSFTIIGRLDEYSRILLFSIYEW